MWLVLATLLILGCSGPFFKITPIEHHMIIQSSDKEFSCYTGGATYAANCCWPYQENLMICLYSTQNELDEKGGSIIIKYIWDKQKKKVVRTVK
jgi:hypothetical protein